MRLRLVYALVISAPFIYACSDKPGPTDNTVGPLQRLAIQGGGTTLRAPAGTALTPVVIIPQDQAGRTVVNQTATFTVIAGGGFIASNTGQTGADGRITAPTWTLGKTDVPQQMRVDVGSVTVTVNASVTTLYALAVRFYGAAVSPGRQGVFTTAASRIRAFIVGQLPPAVATNLDISDCTGTPTTINETIQGTLIYASVDAIDGPGNTLAQAGPCYIRQTGGVNDYRTLIGVMKFDSADIRNLENSGNFQEVITHEMMHVIGLGTFWDENGKNLLINKGVPGTAYTGPAGIAGCRALPGGTIACPTNVPVEDCVGVTSPCGAGNRDGHWKETTFRTELMTGYLNTGTNPLSSMTIRSFEDLGYSVNTAAADAYSATTGNLSSASASSSPLTLPRNWERPLGVPVRTLPTLGMPEIAAR
jgi:hypothetical protein